LLNGWTKAAAGAVLALSGRSEEIYWRTNQLRAEVPAGTADEQAATEFKEAAREFARGDPVEWVLAQLRHSLGRRRSRKKLKAPREPA
jgi:hypothetical protein